MTIVSRAPFTTLTLSRHLDEPCVWTQISESVGLDIKQTLSSLYIYASLCNVPLSL